MNADRTRANACRVLDAHLPLAEDDLAWLASIPLPEFEAAWVGHVVEAIAQKASVWALARCLVAVRERYRRELTARPEAQGDEAVLQLSRRVAKKVDRLGSFSVARISRDITMREAVLADLLRRGFRVEVSRGPGRPRHVIVKDGVTTN
jgi:hypothetical protein